MAKRAPEPVELTYPLGTVARLTGLSPDLLRIMDQPGVDVLSRMKELSA